MMAAPHHARHRETAPAAVLGVVLLSWVLSEYLHAPANWLQALTLTILGAVACVLDRRLANAKRTIAQQAEMIESYSRRVSDSL